MILDFPICIVICLNYEHSLIISPDGKILCELKTGEGVISSKIDPSLPYKLRKSIPSLVVD